MFNVIGIKEKFLKKGKKRSEDKKI